MLKLRPQLILDVVRELLLNQTIKTFGKIPIVVNEHVKASVVP
jgi:hypothetical protein